MTEMFSRLLSYRINALSNHISRTFTNSQAKIPAVELAYTCYQPTNGRKLKEPPLVILHGLFGSKKNWTSLARVFSNSGRKVITVDARNHGESAHHPGMDYLSMTEDVEKLLDKLGISRAIVLGHSMGGKTAMLLAITKPHLVEKLIVEDVAPNYERTSATTAFPQYIAAMKSIQFDAQVVNLSQARRVADKQLHRAFPDKFVRAFVLTNIREGPEGFEWKVNLDAVENHLDGLVGFPQVHDSFLGETLFIGGANSNHIRPEDEPTIRKLFPKVTIEHIAGAGHWVHSEKPKELLQIVQTFIGDHHS